MQIYANEARNSSEREREREREREKAPGYTKYANEGRC